jgi:hypothetical protein
MLQLEALFDAQLSLGIRPTNPTRMFVVSQIEQRMLYIVLQRNGNRMFIASQIEQHPRASNYVTRKQ